MAQADSTGWMAMYCLNLMRMALELSLHDSAYESIASKFFEHFLAIVEAMNHMGSAPPRMGASACGTTRRNGIARWPNWPGGTRSA